MPPSMETCNWTAHQKSQFIQQIIQVSIQLFAPINGDLSND
ncbi:hypothetical protein LBWT_X4220 (plasmid) [Leptolyngbya boryana IAM M-101]|nr:hypothetical protein LBWT_X4220 [Leptolyngbya boryana IAM M-101]BAS66698.1 hypothetical protein LBDG_X4220 [Leptolyngbya boryana dg5]